MLKPSAPRRLFPSKFIPFANIKDCSFTPYLGDEVGDLQANEKTSPMTLNGSLWKILALVALAWTSISCSPATHSTGPVQRMSQAPPVDYLWRQQLTFNKQFWELGHFEFGQPSIIRDGRAVVIGSRVGDLVAMSADDGTELWRNSWEEGIEGSALHHKGRLFIGDISGVMHAVDARTGKELWRYDSGASIQNTPAIEKDTLVFSNARNQVIALNVKTGDFRWSKQRKSIDDFTIYGHAGVIIDDGVVFGGFADGHAIAYALQDGAIIWGRDLSAGTQRFRDIDSTPSISDGMLFVSSFAGGLYALDPTNGRIIWHRKDAHAASTVNVQDEIIYFSAEDGVHATHRRTGKDIWLLALAEEDLPSAPVISERFIYVSLRKRGLMILRRASGNVVTLVNPGGGFSTPPGLIGDRLFLASNRGGFFALLHQQ